MHGICCSIRRYVYIVKEVLMFNLFAYAYLPGKISNRSSFVSKISTFLRNNLLETLKCNLVLWVFCVFRVPEIPRSASFSPLCWFSSYIKKWYHLLLTWRHLSYIYSARPISWCILFEYSGWNTVQPALCSIHIRWATKRVTRSGGCAGRQWQRFDEVVDLCSDDEDAGLGRAQTRSGITL